jgi:hypothetical protein
MIAPSKILNVRERLAVAYKHVPDELTGLGLIHYASELTHGANRCFLCGSPDRLVEDHCHYTGQIRAILCRSCNALEGSGNQSESLVVYRRAAPGLGLHCFYRGRGWERLQWPEPERRAWDCTVFNWQVRSVDFLDSAFP